MKAASKLTALAIALASSSAWGQAATECKNVGTTDDSATPTITVAVASNFYGPGRAIARDFIESTEAGTDKIIRVCHNSSGLLVNEINAGASYSLFLAADNVWPGKVTVAKGAEFPYAYGIPVLWSAKVSTDDLMSNGIINKSKVTSLAIGNPGLAPYGAAAERILKEKLKQWETPGAWITQYDNIALTKTAIKDKVKDAGFVSKAQVCGEELDPPFGVRDEFQAYNIEQKGVQITVADADATATTTAFKDYLLSTEVQASLVSTYCYASSVAGSGNTNSARRR